MERWSVRPSSRALCHYSSKPLCLTVSQNEVSASAREGKPFTPDHIACCFSTETNVIRAAVDCEDKASTFAREISSNARGKMKRTLSASLTKLRKALGIGSVSLGVSAGESGSERVAVAKNPGRDRACMGRRAISAWKCIWHDCETRLPHSSLRGFFSHGTGRKGCCDKMHAGKLTTARKVCHTPHARNEGLEHAHPKAVLALLGILWHHAGVGSHVLLF